MEQTYSAELNDPELCDFLMNAPKKFRENERIRKFQMKNGDFIHCVMYNYHFYISGTDIVKILIYRFQLEGRQINNLKKFEEGIFSDLRNLKPGIDATLEGPRSEFLEFLYKNGCIRTQKKQKVFYWYSVPHDALFCDAMERDMRRETFFVTSKTFGSKPFSPSGIFNNTKTNRNILKQRSYKLAESQPLFTTFGDEFFSSVRRNDVLSKTLFNPQPSMSNIVKKKPNSKKTTLIDDIVNYGEKTKCSKEKLLFTDAIYSEKRSPDEYNLKELDELIKIADLKINETKQTINDSENMNINDIIYNNYNLTDPKCSAIKNTSSYLNEIDLNKEPICATEEINCESYEIGSKVELIPNSSAQDNTK